MIVNRSFGCQLEVVAQPGARRSAVVGVLGDRWKVSVAAPATDGRANEELCRFLAKVAGVGRGAVSIVSGQGSRRKSVAFEGLGVEELQGRLVAAQKTT